MANPGGMALRDVYILFYSKKHLCASTRFSFPFPLRKPVAAETENAPPFKNAFAHLHYNMLNRCIENMPGENNVMFCHVCIFRLTDHRRVSNLLTGNT
jgi:hypothetical protein